MAAIAETLADWAASLEREALPDAVLATARRTLIDTGGLAVAGRARDYVMATRGSAEAEGSCTAIGHAGGFTSADAAMITGIAAHGEDYDDTFEGTPMHVGAVLVPALLAVAERDGLSGADLARGLAAGSELACRMVVVAPTGIHRACFHPTAVIGAVAAAFGAATAERLSPEQTAWALGLAGSMASGIIEYLAEGTWSKRAHPGWSAQAGIRAVALAKRGFTGPRTVFEGEHGFYRAFAHPDIPCDFDRLTNCLGERWEFEALAFKPYACGTMAVPFIDAAIQLRDRIADLSSVAEIVAPTAEAILHRLWEPMAEKTRPSTPYSAKFSIPYAIACGLAEGKAGLAEFTEEKVRDPAILGLASKVRYEVDPDDPYPDNYVGAITVRMKDGTELTASQPCMRGGRRDPLSDAELAAKFRANTAFGGWDDVMAERYLSFCETAFDTDRIDLSLFRA